MPGSVPALAFAVSARGSPCPPRAGDRTAQVTVRPEHHHVGNHGLQILEQYRNSPRLTEEEAEVWDLESFAQGHQAGGG